ncbi:hypothetical protein KPH14_012091 [Odynerus spinipes]|uniref:Cardioactive peptide n=1 Tax=Odynerus spinipes TaxID=1348599 RepID=A0AAD9VI84_9HYME|nr:hypothetical protein KPH14_012091 [Odynerus spinipes]
MKVIGYLLCVISLIFLMQASADRTEDERDIVNEFPTDEMFKIKRPFCNAFTGCGRKRSFYGTLANSPYFDTKNSIRLPIPIYKALIKAASEEIRNTASRGSNDYQLPEITQDFTIFPNREQPLEEVN